MFLTTHVIPTVLKEIGGAYLVAVERMDGIKWTRLARWVGGWMDGITWMRLERWVDGWMDEIKWMRLKRWVDGWMDEYLCETAAPKMHHTQLR
jgi:hypothetical protein